MEIRKNYSEPLLIIAIISFVFLTIVNINSDNFGDMFKIIWADEGVYLNKAKQQALNNHPELLQLENWHADLVNPLNHYLVYLSFKVFDISIISSRIISLSAYLLTSLICGAIIFNISRLKEKYNFFIGVFIFLSNHILHYYSKVGLSEIILVCISYIILYLYLNIKIPIARYGVTGLLLPILLFSKPSCFTVVLAFYFLILLSIIFFEDIKYALKIKYLIYFALSSLISLILIYILFLGPNINDWINIIKIMHRKSHEYSYLRKFIVHYKNLFSNNTSVIIIVLPSILISIKYILNSKFNRDILIITTLFLLSSLFELLAHGEVRKSIYSISFAPLIISSIFIEQKTSNIELNKYLNKIMLYGSVGLLLLAVTLLWYNLAFYNDYLVFPLYLFFIYLIYKNKNIVYAALFGKTTSLVINEKPLIQFCIIVSAALIIVGSSNVSYSQKEMLDDIHLNTEVNSVIAGDAIWFMAGLNRYSVLVNCKDYNNNWDMFRQKNADYIVLRQNGDLAKSRGCLPENILDYKLLKKYIIKLNNHVESIALLQYANN